MSCEDVAAAILDDRLTRPTAFQAHLEQCPRCRELAQLHSSASELRLPAPPPLAPIPARSIVGEVRRRAQRRRTVAGTVVAGAAAVLALFAMPRKSMPEPVMGTPDS